MASFVNLHKVIIKNAFSAFPSAQNEVQLEGGGRKWRVDVSLFTSEREFEFFFKSLNWFDSKQRISKEKAVVVKNEKGEKLEKKIHCVIRFFF